MLALFVYFVPFFVYLVPNFYLFSFFLFVLVVYYFSTVDISSLNSLFSDGCFFINDEMSLFIITLLFLVIYVSYFSAPYESFDNTLSFSMIFLFISCYIVFSTSNFFILYFFYEASIIPIIYIILKWGSYPERSLSSVIIIIYTLLFSAPMLVLLFYLNSVACTFNIYVFCYCSDKVSSFLVSLVIFLCFSVKLPIFGLHYWLPMAHVEAPTFGSVILASVLLKLGGVGLYRFVGLVDIFSLSSYLLSYFVVFIVFATLVCCFQSDLKRLIAYSSVSHIIVVPILFLSNTLLSTKSLIICMFLHGIISSMLFFIVGIVYSVYSSRQLALIRGFALVSPFLSFVFVLCFFYTLSAPPFPTFVIEVFFMMSSYFLTVKFLGSFLVFAFFSLVYNLNWLVSLLISSSFLVHVQSSCLISYRSHLPFFHFFIFSLLFYFLISLV